MPRKPAPLYSHYLNPSGVLYIKVNDNPVWSEAWIPKGRYLVEKCLKRRLHPFEKVIKINGNKSDFQLENLMLIDKLHKRTYIFRPDNNTFVGISHDWSILFKQCKGCQTNKKKHAAFGYCTTCYPKHRSSISS